MEGMELFRDLTSPVSLAMHCFSEGLQLYGLFSPQEELLAVGGVKLPDRILMLYVRFDQKKKGLGSKLLSYLESLCQGERILLNSSDEAVSFYLKHSYHVASSRTVDKGISFTPMEKRMSRIFVEANKVK